MLCGGDSGDYGRCGPPPSETPKTLGGCFSFRLARTLRCLNGGKGSKTREKAYAKPLTYGYVVPDHLRYSQGGPSKENPLYFGDKKDNGLYYSIVHDENGVRVSMPTRELGTTDAKRVLQGTVPKVDNHVRKTNQDNKENVDTCALMNNEVNPGQQHCAARRDSKTSNCQLKELNNVACQNILRNTDPTRDVTTSKESPKPCRNQCVCVTDNESSVKLDGNETGCKLSDESGVGSASGDDSGSRSVDDLEPQACSPGTPEKEAPDAWDIYMGYVMRNIMKGGSTTPPGKAHNCDRAQEEDRLSSNRKSGSDSPDYEPIGCYEKLRLNGEGGEAGSEGCRANSDKESQSGSVCGSKDLGQEGEFVDSGTSSTSLASTGVNNTCESGSETKCAAHGSLEEKLQPGNNSLDPGCAGGMQKHPQNHHVHNSSNLSQRDRVIQNQGAPSPRRSGVKGQLRVGVELQENLLVVSVFSARGLVNRQQNPSTAWCVELQLTPDDQESTCSTQEVRHANAPVFNEKYSFSLLPGDETKRLVISMWQTRGDRRRLAGCMSFGLKHLMGNVNHINGWYYILPSSLGQKKHLRAETTSGSGGIPHINADIHGGQLITVSLPATDSGYGFTVRGSSPVVIARVEPGSSAHRAGVTDDDVIVSINGQNVSRSTAFSVADLIRCSKSVLLLGVQRFGGAPPGAARSWSTLPCRSRRKSGDQWRHSSTLSLSRSRSSTSLASLSDVGSCGSRSTVASAISQRTEEYLFGNYGVPRKPLQEINNNDVQTLHSVTNSSFPSSVMSTFESFTSDLTKMTNNLLTSPERSCRSRSCHSTLSPLLESDRTMLGPTSVLAAQPTPREWTQGCVMHSTPAIAEEGFSDNTTAWSSPSCVCPDNSPASNTDHSHQGHNSSEGEVFHTCRMTSPHKRMVSRCSCDDANSSDLDLSVLEKECWDIVAELDSSDSGEKSACPTPVRAGNTARPMQRRVLRRAFDSDCENTKSDSFPASHKAPSPCKQPRIQGPPRHVTRFSGKPPAAREVLRTQLSTHNPSFPSPALSTPRCDQDTMGTMLSSRYYSDDSPSIMPQFAEKDSGCSSASLDSRQGAIDRLLRGEEDYVHQMGFGAQRFSRPLRHYILSAEEHLVLFQNVEKLLAISEFHVAQLQTDGAGVAHHGPHSEHLQAAAVYLQRLPLIVEAYRTYCAGLSQALKLLDKLVKHRVFVQFLQNPPPQPGQLSIKDFIQRPQQHLCELMSCFERLLASSPTHPQEHQMLSQLVQGFQSCLQPSRHHSRHRSDPGTSLTQDDRGSICSQSSLSTISRVSGGTRWSATSGLSTSSRLTSRSRRQYPSSIVGYPGADASRSRSMCSRSVARSACLSTSGYPGLPVPRASSTQSHLAVMREATLTIHSRETLLSDASLDPELVQLQGRLVFPKNKIYHLLAPTRHVVYAGDVLWEDSHSSWVKVLAILLNDLILITRQEETGQLRVLRDPIYFSDVITCSFDSANAGEFSLLIHEQSNQMKRRRYVILRAANQELRCTWQQLLAQRVQACRKQAEHFL